MNQIESKLIYKTYVYRVYPNKYQTLMIQKTFGCCRLVYNKLLEQKIYTHQNKGIYLSKNYCINYFRDILKKEYPFLNEPSEKALINSIYDLDKSFENSRKNSKFPKFKCKHTSKKSFKVFNNNDIIIDFNKNKVKIPTLNWLKTKIHRKFNGKVNNITLKQLSSGEYYIHLVVFTRHIISSKVDGVVGIDLGLKNLIILSNGIKYDNIKISYKYQKKLARLQRQLARKKFGSNNFYKLKRRIAKLYQKIKNIRNSYLHLISHQIVNNNNIIIFENLNVQGLIKNHKFSRSIMDASWYKLVKLIEYKADWNNKIVHKINRFYPSSQLCSICKNKNPRLKNLSIRIWICPFCGAKHDRDINAAVNILDKGLKDLNIN